MPPPDKGDPLEGIEAAATKCLGCRALSKQPFPQTHRSSALTIEKGQMVGRICQGKPVRLLPEPAVRKVMAERWREFAKTMFDAVSDKQKPHTVTHRHPTLGDLTATVDKALNIDKVKILRPFIEAAEAEADRLERGGKP